MKIKRATYSTCRYSEVYMSHPAYDATCQVADINRLEIRDYYSNSNRFDDELPFHKRMTTPVDAHSETRNMR